MLQLFRDSILSLVYPQACKVCGSSVEQASCGVACEECWAATRLFTGDETLCARCGQFLSPTGARADSFCRRCDDHHYDSAAAAGIYEHALAAAVINLKNYPVIHARARGALIAAFRRSGFRSDVIVPVPLSRMRRHERGFNQAEVLAEALAKATGLKAENRVLVRTKHTEIHRAAMDRKARAASVKDAFKVERPRLVDGRSILLIDDVFTSGSTASYCAKALKKAGAGEVRVLTLARASR